MPSFDGPYPNSGKKGGLCKHSSQTMNVGHDEEDDDEGVDRLAVPHPLAWCDVRGPHPGRANYVTAEIRNESFVNVVGGE